MNALLIHGYGNKGTDAFFPKLSQYLNGKKFSVESPSLPIVSTNGYNDSMQPLRDIAVDKHISLIVGHSSGCYLALKFAEANKVDNLILVAPQISANFWGKQYTENILKDFGQQDGEQYIEFHSHDIDFTKVESNTSKVTIIRGSLDPYIPKEFVETIQKNLPHSRYLELEGRKHMGVDDGCMELPEIYEFIS